MAGKRLVSPSRFFESAGPFKIDALADLSGAKVERRGDESRLYCGVASLEKAGADDVSYYASQKYEKTLKASRAGACLLFSSDRDQAPEHMALLVSDNPHHSYVRLCAAFYPEAARPSAMWGESGVSPDASIDESAELEASVAVEPNAVVGAGAKIGAGTRITAGAVIGRGVSIGREGYVGPGASVSHAIIGDRVFIHAGARIGQDGFSYVPYSEGLAKVPQLGRVIIQNDVEIGANSTIDRGSYDDTTIGEGTKIDNLVHIGHNCRIGRFCIIVSMVGLSGSVHIEDNVVLGGQAGVADHLTIGAGTQVAGRGGVTRSLPSGGVYMGFPARPAGQWRRETAALNRLAREALRKNSKKKRGKDDRS